MLRSGPGGLLTRPLLRLPPAHLVHIHDGGPLDGGPGYLDHGRQRGTLRLLLPHHCPQRHPARPQILQELPYVPPAQPIVGTQESNHGSRARTVIWYSVTRTASGSNSTT